MVLTDLMPTNCELLFLAGGDHIIINQKSFSSETTLNTFESAFPSSQITTLLVSQVFADRPAIIQSIQSIIHFEPITENPTETIIPKHK